jgi:purine catabolism regulator
MDRAVVDISQTVTVHRTLLDLALQNRGMDAMLDALARLVNLPAVLFDTEGRLLACSDENIRLQAQDLTAELDWDGIILPGQKAVRQELNRSQQPYSWFVQPVRAGAEILGHICILENNARLHPAGIALAEEAAVVIALEFQKLIAMDEIERRYSNDFVRDLLEGRIESKSSAVHRGVIYKWDVTKPQVLFAIQLVTSMGYGVSHPSIDSKIHYLKRIEKVIQGVMVTHSTHPRGSYLVAHLGDVNVMLLVPASSSPIATKEEAVKLAKVLLPQLQGVMDDQALTVKIGISRICYDLFGFPTAFHEALEAIQMTVELDSSGLIAHYDDLGVSRLLMRIDDAAEMERFCDEYLGKLIEYDLAHSTELLTTLRIVIETDGHLREAAQKLFIHYNTLRYRLKKIKEISGLEFKSWREIAQIVLAVEIYHILQVKKAALIR